MSIINDYWNKWLAGETTDKEVDAYIRVAFAHLVYEYRSVYFVKCVCKGNVSTAGIGTNVATDVEKQNQDQEQAQGTGNVQENMTGLETELTEQSDIVDTIAIEKQNQNQNQDLLQSVVEAQKSLTGLESESTQQSDTGNAITVEEQNLEKEQEQASGGFRRQTGKSEN